MKNFTHWLLYSYITSVVLISHVPVGNKISQWTGFILLFTWVVKDLLLERKSIIIPTEAKFFFMFIIISVFGSFFAMNPDVVFTRVLTLVQLLNLFLIIYNLTLSSGESIITWKNNIICIVVAGTMSMVYALITTDGFNDIANIRLGGTFHQTNAYAFALVFFIIFSFIVYKFAKNNFIKMFLISIIGIGLIQLLLTGSRQGVLGVIIAGTTAVFANFVYTKKIRLQTYSLFGLLILGLFLFITYLPFQDLYIHERISNLFLFVQGKQDIIAEESLFVRISYYDAAVQMFKANPLFGVGLNHFQFYALDYGALGSGTYAHSNYFELLATSGLTGFVTYFTIYLLVLYRFYYIIKKLKPNNKTLIYILIILISAYTAFMFIDFAGVAYYRKFEWIVLSLIISGLAAIKKSVIEHINNYDINYNKIK